MSVQSLRIAPQKFSRSALVKFFNNAMRESDLSQQGDHYSGATRESRSAGPLAQQLLLMSPDPRLRAATMCPNLREEVLSGPS
jgi:hypothetical protein